MSAKTEIERARQLLDSADSALVEALAQLDGESGGGGLRPGYISENFKEAEFTCNHCNSMEGQTVPQELLEMLEDVRSHFGDAPITVNSGYRCRVHNTNVGSSEGSWHRYHTPGEGAADIVVSGVSPQTVHQYLVNRYPYRCGIGRYNSFTHLDNDKDKRRW